VKKKKRKAKKKTKHPSRKKVRKRKRPAKLRKGRVHKRRTHRKKKPLRKKKALRAKKKKKLKKRKPKAKKRGRKLKKKFKPKALEKPPKPKKIEVAEVESTADRSAMQIYLKQIEKIPLLKPEDEVALSKDIQSKSRKAKRSRERMIRSNLRLVISIAKRYTNLGLLFSDLVEEGNIGLMRAVEKFNWRRGYRFSTYASWWIKQAIMRAISNHGKTIRIPVYMYDTLSRFRKVKEGLSQKLGRLPTDAELAKSMKIPEEKVKELENTISMPSSLNAPISLEGSAELMDVIEDTKSQTPHREVEAVFRNERVKEMLKFVDEREREILIRRFGLDESQTPQTLEEVAKAFNITRERVRQIEGKALEKIRQRLEEETDSLVNYL